jgi:proteasome accessory factor B
MQPLERLVNLVALLLESRRPLTFEEIRERLGEAYEQEDPSTAKRMFERDKDVLRDKGVPIEVVPIDAFEVEEGYVIDKAVYYLPEISFTPEEISALIVAARSGEENPDAEHAAQKLLSGTDGVLSAVPGGILAAEPGADRRLAALAEAIAERRRVRYGYRTSVGAVSERQVDPYGLLHRSGHWYLVGLDHERGDIRSFRLSRLTTEVVDAGRGNAPPEGFRAADHVHTGPFGPGGTERPARVAFSPEVAWWATKSITGAVVDRPRSDGWVEVTLPTGPLEGLASWVLQFGPDAEVVAPASLRDEVVQRLEAVLGSL